jgi:lysozyme family protein
MTLDQILDGILDREGDAVITNHRADRGGRTRYGISERAHPAAWNPGPPTREQARAIYTTVYVAPFDALFGRVDDRIRVALIDDAVLSGVKPAIRRLQHVLQVVPLDGVLGPLTVAACLRQPSAAFLQRLVVARALGLCRVVQTRPANLVFLTGWIARTLTFLPQSPPYDALNEEGGS